MNTIKDPIALRDKTVEVLFDILKGGVTDRGVVATETAGSLSITYATVADKLEAVRLLIQMGAI